MRRRVFIAGLGAAAWAPSWPRTATAQQVSRMARVGFIHYVDEHDPNGLDLARLFRQGMERLGWTLGYNLVIDYRWGVFDKEKARLAAAEILRLAPDVIVCGGSPTTIALKQATRTVPIVFANVSEPVLQGIVESLARPGGNLTGSHFSRSDHRWEMAPTAYADRAASRPCCIDVQPGLRPLFSIVFPID